MPSSYSLVNMPSGIFPVYFLEGDDDFLISECSAELKGSFPPEILSDFNYAKVAATKKFLSSEVEALAEELPIMAPFKTIEGLGENAASSIIEARNEAPFTSKEDLLRRTKLNNTNVERLAAMHVLDNLPESEQLSLFDFSF